MKCEKSDTAVICLGVMSIIIQWGLMHSSQIFEISLPFACGLSFAEEDGGAVSQLLFFIIPVPFLLWIFSGRIERILTVIGPSYIIRNYSRERLFILEVGRQGVGITLLGTFTYFVFSFGKSVQWEELSGKNELKVMIMWSMTMMAAVLLQGLLELLTNAQIAQIITLLYYVGSLFIGSLLATKKTIFWRWILFPNMAFSECNGVIEGERRVFLSSFIGIFLLCIVLMLVSLRILKKKDVI